MPNDITRQQRLGVNTENQVGRQHCCLSTFHVCTCAYLKHAWMSRMFSSGLLEFLLAYMVKYTRVNLVCHGAYLCQVRFSTHAHTYYKHIHTYIHIQIPPADSVFSHVQILHIHTCTYTDTFQQPFPQFYTYTYPLFVHI